MKNVYIASSLNNKDRFRQLRNQLIERGINITYDWTSHGFVDDESELINIALAEVKGVGDSDCVLMITPARKGSHFEFGYAYAKNIPVVILIEEKDYVPVSFHYLVDENGPIVFKTCDSSKAIEKVIELSSK